MFHCYVHGWSSHEYMCPICSSNMTFTSTSASINTPLDVEDEPITEGQLKDLEYRVEKVEAANKITNDNLAEALALLYDAYEHFGMYNPTGASKAGKTLKKIKTFLTNINED